MIYTERGFAPSVTTIAPGETVVFDNTSEQPMRVSPAPWLGGNTTPGFGAESDIAPGESYSFTFTTAGLYGYVDSLAKNFMGIVEVAE